MSRKDPAEKAIRDIRRKTRKRYSAEEKIRIVLSGLRGEESITTDERLAGPEVPPLINPRPVRPLCGIGRRLQNMV